MLRATLKLPNPTFLVGEEESMIDEKVLHQPCAPFVYELRCPNVQCGEVFHQVTLSRGLFCPVCRLKDPNHKTYRRLVKVTDG